MAHVRLLEQLLSEGTREAFAFSVYKNTAGERQRGEQPSPAARLRSPSEEEPVQ